jgi:hypothetical protein
MLRGGFERHQTLYSERAGGITVAPLGDCLSPFPLPSFPLFLV